MLVKMGAPPTWGTFFLASSMHLLFLPENELSKTTSITGKNFDITLSVDTFAFCL